jgi:hypothetical protein
MTRKMLVALFAVVLGLAMPASAVKASCCAPGSACCPSHCCK